ncbi:class I SAM-dependent methyltransferase [Paracraurococcus lichenis]|uniref:Class I SAM-dependent methyltransferase n=1 Tax=Paracraurococcus lichenis TaxID=3064888 RepID=A0ABT9E9S4_9PROT|nr:class I SAM-dependent methyltransferase [Paracraurococcus sp. LOR1-02]MDO9712948.1 class I SAM-dependent methyltransferase [Paracraurococcus sp. LOR1-02]
MSGTAWGGGYVTDVRYGHGYFPEQSPPLLRAACLLNGVAWDVPDEGGHYLELGCGQGLGAVLVAAANPSWRVTAVDFAPAHIAGARALAREAGIGNVEFIEADLAGFAGTPACAALPEADIVTLHGVWSWVGPAVREGVVRLLASKLRAGGVAHVSYNALPGWQRLLGLQRVVRETGLRLADRSDRQALAGFEVAQALLAAEAGTLRGDPALARWLDIAAGLSPEYLAHEYMNAHWQPCWHAEVAGALAAAKLDWVGTATLPEAFPGFTMTAAQREIYERFSDPLARELVKDVCLGRTLRHDVYVRGARRLGEQARDDALRSLMLALCVPPARMRYEVEVGAGRAELSPDYYGPVVAALAEGPRSVADLLRLAPRRAGARENPAELVGVLAGTRQAMVLARPGAAPHPAALRLNRVVARRFGVREHLNRGAGLASTALGAAMPVTTACLFACANEVEGGAPDLEDWTENLGAGLDAEDRARLQEALRRAVDEDLPILRALACHSTWSRDPLEG